MTEPNPDQIYLEIRQKLEDGVEFSTAEAKIEFMRLFHALRATLSEKNLLNARLASAEQLITELNIDNTLKDIEIFNFTTQIEEKDNN